MLSITFCLNTAGTAPPGPRAPLIGHPGTETGAVKLSEVVPQTEEACHAFALTFSKEARKQGTQENLNRRFRPPGWQSPGFFASWVPYESLFRSSVQTPPPGHRLPVTRRSHPTENLTHLHGTWIRK